MVFFEALRPARQACFDQLRSLGPSGPSYPMMFVIISALAVAAEFFTKRRGFYSVSSPDIIGERLKRDARAARSRP
ncbi:hypothetical protein BH10PSE3_BH10PSE3_16210 [soil metagenome]